MGTIPGSEGDEVVNLESGAPFSQFCKQLSQFFEIFKKTPGSSKNPADWEVVGCVSPAAAYALVQTFPRNLQKPLLVVTENHREALNFFQNLKFFSSGHTNLQILLYPEFDLSPYVPSSPNVFLTAQRLECLFTLMNYPTKPLQQLIVIAPIKALMEKVLDPESLLRSTLFLTVGEEIERKILCQHLLEAGYAANNLVEDRGNFALRGSIVDIFPPLEKNPLRLEFFGDELESIRSFDVDSQRTLPQKENDQLQDITLLPVREIFLDDVTLRRAQKEFKQRMDDMGIAKGERERLVELVANRIYFPGIEHYLSLFRKNLVLPTEYFSADSSIHVILRPRNVFQKFFQHSREIGRCFEEAREDFHPTSVIQPGERYIYIAQEQVKGKFSWLGENQEKWQSLRFEELDVVSEDHEKPKEVVRVVSKSHDNLRSEMENARKGFGEPLKPLLDLLREYQERQYHVLLVCGRKAQSRRLMEMLTQHEISVEIVPEPKDIFLSKSFKERSERPPQKSLISIVVGEVSEGFLLPGEALVMISEQEIFGPRRRRWSQAISAAPRSEGSNVTKLISAFSELSEGDYVVHLDFGIGRYYGLKNMNLGGIHNDFLYIEYKDGDKLYLPIHRLSRIQKYVGGEFEAVSLNRLGNAASWEKIKEKVGRNIKEVAKELLELYATRQVSKGHSFGAPGEFYREFEAEFPYEETSDQSRSIDETLSDMQNEKPMDRLVCGDVGFGKTEVAIRAMFLAAMEGYQTAFLAPTTVLVHQHFQNFRKRFSGYPIEVGMLSRFANRTEIQETIQNLKEGKIDIVVGTHRLLSPDISFKKLGLLIIDEEQRFGVRHKERVKMFKKNLDVLTLSATPIPRTLNMAMIGIRDLSVINTPPLDRVAIRTFISEFDDRVIREAILQEIQRGGQAYFVHNRVNNIEQMASYLRELVAEARVCVAHGQLSETKLEQIMVDFVDRKFDVLVCSSIIESGLDIPSVNTIMINRADQFGLSQLYQLRGRVGRSNRRAYAYLLIPGRYLISEKSQKRLQVLQKNTELGSGFRVASYDLEIRGAGNLLGKSQSGHVNMVGLELYAGLMNKAIRELKGEKVEEEVDPEIDLRIPAFIPEDYIADDSLRLGTYKRLSMFTAEEEVDEMEMELQDRFGPLPREAKNLLKVIEAKVLAREAFVTKLVFGGSTISISFDERTPVAVEHLLHLVNTHKGWRITPDNRLVVTYSSYPDLPENVIPIDREERVLQETRKLLEKLLKKV